MPTHTTTDFSVLTLPNRSVRFRSMGKSAFRFFNLHFGFCNRTRHPSSWWISIKKSKSGFHGFLFTVQSGNQKGFAKLFSWTLVFSLLIMCSRTRPLSLRTVYQSFFGSPTGITPLGIYPVFIAKKGGSRPTRRLPHAKMLLVPIRFFLCWLDYALEGSTFSLSKCDFSPALASHWEVMAYISIHCGFCLRSCRICPLMQEHFLWPLLKRKAFYCGWIRVLLFSKVPSGSE